MRERDTQKQKLYRAENAIRKEHKGEEFESVEKIEAYCKNLVKQKWFQRTFAARPVHRVEVRDGRGRRIACCKGNYHGTAVICLPKWARHELIILHELAHALVSDKLAAHGREFCAVLLRLVRNRIGKEAEAALKMSMRQHHVKWRPKRQLSPEQREKMRQRGAALMAARKNNEGLFGRRKEGTGGVDANANSSGDNRTAQDGTCDASQS